MTPDWFAPSVASGWFAACFREMAVRSRSMAMVCLYPHKSIVCISGELPMMSCCWAESLRKYALCSPVHRWMWLLWLVPTAKGQSGFLSQTQCLRLGHEVSQSLTGKGRGTHSPWLIVTFILSSRLWDWEAESFFFLKSQERWGEKERERKGSGWRNRKRKMLDFSLRV